MRTIGLLGGMGWLSSAEYYRLVNELVRERLGGIHSARCVLCSIDHAEIKSLHASNHWDDAGILLSDAACRAQAAGAELLVLCSNTMHRMSDVVAAAVDIPLVHIADSAAARVRESGLAKVGVIGTQVTMEGDFYRGRMEQNGLSVLTPSQVQRAAIDRIIFRELVQGVISEQSRAFLQKSIAQMVESGAEGVVLACTELELFVDDADSSVPLFPTIRIHAEAAVEAALAPLTLNSQNTA
jgi:aspartate racemase